MPANLLEYAHVVYRHVLRELGGLVRIARPLPPYRNVQDEEERVVERVILRSRYVLIDAVKWLVVQQPSNTRFIPIDGEDVEFISKGLTERNPCALTRVLVLRVIIAKVHGAMNVIRS